MAAEYAGILNSSRRLSSRVSKRAICAADGCSIRSVVCAPVVRINRDCSRSVTVRMSTTKPGALIFIKISFALNGILKTGNDRHLLLEIRSARKHNSAAGGLPQRSDVALG